MWWTNEISEKWSIPPDLNTALLLLMGTMDQDHYIDSFSKATRLHLEHPDAICLRIMNQFLSGSISESMFKNAVLGQSNLTLLGIAERSLRNPTSKYSSFLYKVTKGEHNYPLDDVAFSILFYYLGAHEDMKGLATTFLLLMDSKIPLNNLSLSLLETIVQRDDSLLSLTEIYGYHLELLQARLQNNKPTVALLNAIHLLLEKLPQTPEVSPNEETLVTLFEGLPQYGPKMQNYSKVIQTLYATTKHFFPDSPVIEAMEKQYSQVLRQLLERSVPLEE